MDTYDHDPMLFTRANAGDDSLFVIFYNGVIRNDHRSNNEGREIFDDVECVRIIVPGDRNNVLDRPATQQDKQRFGKQYALFQQGIKGDDQISGTRLEDWSLVSRAQCEEFKYLGIRTVEQLAEVRDDIVSRVPGMVKLKQVAAAWLARSKGVAEVARTQKQLSEQQQLIETLQATVKSLGERLEAVTAKG